MGAARMGAVRIFNFREMGCAVRRVALVGVKAGLTRVGRVATRQVLGERHCLFLAIPGGS